MSIARLTQWDRSVAAFVRVHGRFGGGLPEVWFVGRLRRNTRLFLAGDIVFSAWWNGGGERQPVCGFSSRGFEVRHFYLPYARYAERPKDNYGERLFDKMDDRPLWLPHSNTQHTNLATMEIVELPDALAKMSPADPVVRRYAAETLCAGDTARPVGAGSRALSQTS